MSFLQGSQILKKGKYGFYNAVKPFNSVYENLANQDASGNSDASGSIVDSYPDSQNIVNSDGTTNSKITYAQKKTTSSTTTTTSTPPATTSLSSATPPSTTTSSSTNGSKGIADFGNFASTFQTANSSSSILNASNVDATTAEKQYDTKMRNDAAFIGGRLKNDANSILEDSQNITNTDPVKGMYSFFQMFMDVLLLVRDIGVGFDINADSHPNYFDLIGDALGNGYYKLFGELDKNDKDHYKEYILSVIYFFTSIFIAYFATKNWYYFLIYEFSKESSVFHKIQFIYNWIYRIIIIADLVCPILYPVYILSYCLQQARSFFMEVFKNGYFGESFDHSWMIQIVLFFCLFFVIQNWTTISSNDICQKFFLALFLLFALICIIKILYESWSSIENYKIIYFIVCVFGLYIYLFFANTFISYSFIFVMLLVLFMTFFYIIFCENGIYNSFRVIHEMNMVSNLLYDNAIIQSREEDSTTTTVLRIYYYFGKFATNNWFLFSISFIVFGFMVVCFSTASTLTIHLGFMCLALLLCLAMLLTIRFYNLYNTVIDETTMYHHIESLSELFSEISQDNSRILSSSIQYILSTYKKQMDLKTPSL